MTNVRPTMTGWRLTRWLLFYLEMPLAYAAVVVAYDREQQPQEMES